MDLSKIKPLTLQHNGIANVIICSVKISQPISLKAEGVDLISSDVLAIWDTGASNSAITELAAEKLQLISTGMTSISGLGGTMPKKKYIVDVVLPNAERFLNLPITEIDNPKDADGNKLDSFGMLIGMDIISKGDFSITNFEGKTVMSFRMPSCGKVDFVDEWNRRKSVQDKLSGRGRR